MENKILESKNVSMYIIETIWDMDFIQISKNPQTSYFWYQFEIDSFGRLNEFTDFPSTEKYSETRMNIFLNVHLNDLYMWKMENFTIL